MSIKPSLNGDKIDVEADTKDAGLNFESAIAKESGRNRVYVYGTNTLQLKKRMSRGEPYQTRTHILREC